MYNTGSVDSLALSTCNFLSMLIIICNIVINKFVIRLSLKKNINSQYNVHDVEL